MCQGAPLGAPGVVGQIEIERFDTLGVEGRYGAETFSYHGSTKPWMSLHSSRLIPK